MHNLSGQVLESFIVQSFLLMEKCTNNEGITSNYERLWVVDERGLSLLHYSCMLGHLNAVKILLQVKCLTFVENLALETCSCLPSIKFHWQTDLSENTIRTSITATGDVETEAQGIGNYVSARIIPSYPIINGRQEGSPIADMVDSYIFVL